MSGLSVIPHHYRRHAARPRRPLRWPATAVVTLVAAALLTACSSEGGPNTITLYNGQHPQLTQAIVSAFEKQTGVHVRVKTDDGIILADEILQEGSNSPADVYLTENSPELMMLTQHHLLAQLPASTTDQIPARYDSPTGNWVGVALRVSALAYDPSRISVSQLPASVMELAQPAWKGKVAIAPTDSDFVPLVGAVISTYGQPAALAWLRGLKKNSAIYQDDESVVAAVDRGQATVGIINQYYWYRLRLEQGPPHTHSRLYYFPNGDVGGIENVSGAAVLASSHHQANAEKFVAFLASPTAQQILAAGDDYEYPALPGVAPNPALPPLSEIHPAVINVVSLGNDLPAATLLQKAGLT
jgi:iron(III) transport system substrate-binding protein